MNILTIIIVFGIVLVSMILHELAHGLVAFCLGDTTAKEEGRLTLNPLAHLDPFTSLLLPMLLFMIGGPVFGGAKPVPVNTRNIKFGAWGMALVAVAGPLTNFLLALVGFEIGYHAGYLNGDGVNNLIVVNFVMINLGFCVFNLLPIPPLDGSRILYAIAPDRIRELMTMAEQKFGILTVFLLVMVFGTALSTVMGTVIKNILEFFYLITV